LITKLNRVLNKNKIRKETRFIIDESRVLIHILVPKVKIKQFIKIKFNNSKNSHKQIKIKTKGHLDGKPIIMTRRRQLQADPIEKAMTKTTITSHRKRELKVITNKEIRAIMKISISSLTESSRSKK